MFSTVNHWPNLKLLGKLLESLKKPFGFWLNIWIIQQKLGLLWSIFTNKKCHVISVILHWILKGISMLSSLWRKMHEPLSIIILKSIFGSKHRKNRMDNRSHKLGDSELPVPNLGSKILPHFSCPTCSHFWINMAELFYKCKKLNK